MLPRYARWWLFSPNFPCESRAILMRHPFLRLALSLVVPLLEVAPNSKAKSILCVDLALLTSALPTTLSQPIV